ncbi:MAG: 5-(carboxyamino)imidazole ribonucleotide mutase [Thermosulfidibacteraceae bacterium]
MADVAVIVGSTSDIELAKRATSILEEFGVSYETRVLSAHRTPELLKDYVKDFEVRGGKVFIAFAGYAAHLAGVIASYTTLPVIGVPVASSVLNGMDALLSMVQMPEGIPVATVTINGGANAALLAVSILSTFNQTLKEKLLKYREERVRKIEEANKNLR